ncbi:NADH:flavin oxidoreductase [Mycobacterium tuberculosis]|nr:NADH:flavin oxidoreductase [Mycobacterium tuberculosis]
MPASVLLQPISLGSTVVRNRFVITAHGASERFRNPGLRPEPYIEYLRRRAGSGVGLIIAQALYVSPTTDYPEEMTTRHAELAEAVKAEGATLMLQLVHLGATFRSEADVHRPPLWGFGNNLTDQGETAHAMTGDEIELMIKGYGRIARMAVEAGFDGCEVHGAHGYLGQQSISPWLNQRDDEWGEDRTLFLRRVIEEVRGVLGRNRILGYRTAADDLKAVEDGGLGFQGTVEVVKRLVATGDIDVINTTVGHGGKTYTRAIPSYRYGEAPNIPKIRSLREEIGNSIPMIGVGRIVSVGVAESLVENGDVDMVAMTRAHIADPDLVAKFERGETHRIRPCVGALVCNSRKLAGFSEISCIHNPEVLRELELVPRPTAAPRNIVVAGAGPAGLKFAEIAVKRGHRVRVFDTSANPGGSLRYVESTAASDLVSTTDHLVSELALSGVKPELGTSVDEQFLKRSRPDVLVIATGAAPDLDELFLGSETTQVVSGIDALAGAEIDDDVVVYDALGASEGALVAEALARRGKRVTMVTPYEAAMPYAGISHRMETPDILRKKLKAIYTEAVVGMADGRSLTIVRPGGEEIAEVEAGTVVAVTPLRPRTELSAVAAELGIEHVLIGDAVAPRQATDAFRDGEEAAHTI